MNKTFIKLDNPPSLIPGPDTNSVDERAGPILKPMGAFRHTEYARGFYKVGNGTVGAAATALDSLESAQSDYTPFSEIER